MRPDKRRPLSGADSTGTHVGHTDAVRSDFQQLVARVLDVPSSARHYDVTESNVRAHYGLEADDLEGLVSFGLPHQESDGQRVFCAADLHYIALRLRASGPSLMLSRLQAQTLVRVASSTGIEFEVDFVPRKGIADTPTTDSRLQDAPASPLPADVTQLASPGHKGTLLSIVTKRFKLWPEIPSGPANVVARLGEFDWYKLPLSLAADTRFAAATNLYTCLTAAAKVHDALQAVGYAVRKSYGLLLGVPYSTPHAWVEIGNNGDWVPIDPFLLGTLSRFGGLRAEEWPLTRSSGHVVLRFSEMPARMVDYGAGPSDLVYITRFRSQGASAS